MEEKYTKYKNYHTETLHHFKEAWISKLLFKFYLAVDIINLNRWVFLESANWHEYYSGKYKIH